VGQGKVQLPLPLQPEKRDMGGWPACALLPKLSVTVTPDLYERERLVVTRSKFILAEGPLQNQDGVIHVKAAHLLPLSDETLEIRSHDFH
jgi:hypothetical protein